MMAEHVAHIEEMRNTYKIIVGKPKGKQPMSRWEDSIKIVLKRKGV
jgi:hypothetical protein